MEDGVSLKEMYPRLYQISQQQNQHIQQMGTIAGIGWEWKLQWKRFFLEAKIDTVAKFMEDLQRYTCSNRTCGDRRKIRAISIQ